MSQIREVLNQDLDQIWKFFQPIVLKGETYIYRNNTSKEEALGRALDKISTKNFCLC